MCSFSVSQLHDVVGSQSSAPLRPISVFSPAAESRSPPNHPQNAHESSGLHLELCVTTRRHQRQWPLVVWKGQAGEQMGPLVWPLVRGQRTAHRRVSRGLGPATKHRPASPRRGHAATHSGEHRTPRPPRGSPQPLDPLTHRDSPSLGSAAAASGHQLPSSHPAWPPLSLHTTLCLPQDPLPWSVCPPNANRTGYEEECEKASSTQYFWYRKTLNISPSIQQSGAVQWEPALCLVLAWLVVYLCMLRGTESTGKVGGPEGGREAHLRPGWGGAGGGLRRPGGVLLGGDAEGATRQTAC